VTASINPAQITEFGWERNAENHSKLTEQLPKVVANIIKNP
jgi:hypothetical protein